MFASSFHRLDLLLHFNIFRESSVGLPRPLGKCVVFHFPLSFISWLVGSFCAVICVYHLQHWFVLLVEAPLRAVQSMRWCCYFLGFLSCAEFL